MKTELIFREEVFEFSDELRKLALGKRPIQKPNTQHCQRPARRAAPQVATRNQKPVKTDVDIANAEPLGQKQAARPLLRNRKLKYERTNRV